MPGALWSAGSKLQRVRDGFDAAGIQFAYPTVTIHQTTAAASIDDQAVQAAAKLAIPAPANGAPAPA